MALAGPSAALAAPGDLDPSFGDGGTSRFDLGVRSDPNPGNSGGLAAALQGSGRLLIAGWSGDQGGSNTFLLVGVDEHGHLDPAFGDGGVVRTGVGCGSDVAHALAVQGDGRIVLGGGGSCSGNAAARSTRDQRHHQGAFERGTRKRRQDRSHQGQRSREVAEGGSGKEEAGGKERGQEIIMNLADG